MNPFKLITKPLGCLCSLIGSLVLLAVVLAIGLLLAFNYLAPRGVTEIVESRSGFPAQVDRAGWQLLDSAFTVEDLIIQNPPNFPERDFLHLRDLTVRAKIRKLTTSPEGSVEQVNINIERFNWVRTQGGATNLDLFLRTLRENWAAKQETTVDALQLPEDSPAVDTDLAIQHWTVRLGTVETNDYSQGPVQRDKHILDLVVEVGPGTSPAQAIREVVSQVPQPELQPLIAQLLEALLLVTEQDGLLYEWDPRTEYLRGGASFLKNFFEPEGD